MGDVARIAGVCASTVSHVLNSTRRGDAATRMRVEAAIAETGYRRNVMARSLAAGRTHTVGLSISALTNPYFGSLVHAVERALSDAGYVLIVGDWHDDVTSEKQVTDSLLDRQVDGMIVAPAAGSERVTLPDITRAGVPLVLIDRGLAVDAALVLDGDSNTDGAEHAVRSLMSGVSRPTALESLNNAMAIGTLKAVRGLGLSIPTDVAFVCYDDFEWSDLFEPRLTAVA